MRDTQLQEIDLQSGILSNATGLQVGGTRLRRSENAAWAPLWNQTNAYRRGLAILPHASTVPTVTFDGQHVLGLGFISGGDLGRTGIGAVRTDAGMLRFAKLSNGMTVLTTGAGVPNRSRSAPAVYWTGIETPAVYISHPDAGETWRGTEAGLAAYEPTNDPGAPFKGNTALAIHLDRLWLARINIETGPMDSLIWYSDPFDPETVRATSFLQIVDNVRCMFQPGASDAGTPHLVIGGDRAIHVLDGDPQFGNAVLRRLSWSVGIADLCLVAQTHIGAVILATDGRFYLIPSDATQLIPIPGLEDQVVNPRDFGSGDAFDSLAWSPPYVYYMAADANRLFALDLRVPQQPKWWGPLTHAAGAPFVARIHALNPGADNVTAPLWMTTFAADVGKLYRITTGAAQATGRAVVLRTGTLNQPGHKVELRRVIVELLRTLEPMSVTLTLYLTDGTTKEVSRVTKTTDALDPDAICTLIYDFQSGYMGSSGIDDGIWMELAFPAGEEPGVQRWLCEYRVQPKQH